MSVSGTKCPLAKAPHSGHPDVGGIYLTTVRLSLEPDFLFSA